MEVKKIKPIRVKRSQEAFIRLLRLAAEVVLREDRELLKALAKH